MPTTVLLFGRRSFAADGVDVEGGLVNGVEEVDVVEEVGAGGPRRVSERMVCVVVKFRPEAEGREKAPRARTKRRRQRVQIIMTCN